MPHAVKSEIAQLTSKFTVDYANEGDDGYGQAALVCSISELYKVNPKQKKFVSVLL